MSQNVIAVLSLGSLYLVFALGLSLTWGTIDVLNFGHGATFMFSAFVASSALGRVELPLVSVMAIAAAVGAVLAGAFQVIVVEQILRRSRRRQDAEMQILVAGIGAAIIPLALAQHSTRSLPFGLGGSSFSVTVTELAGIRILNIQIITIAFALIVALLVAVVLRRTRLGLATRSIGIDSEVAVINGVNRRALALAVSSFGGMLAGVAGVLFTFSLGAIAPESGDALLFKAFAIVILGGVGSVAGVAIGAFFLALTETVVLTQTNGLWVDAVALGLIFLILLLRPAGLFGTPKVERS